MKSVIAKFPLGVRRCVHPNLIRKPMPLASFRGFSSQKRVMDENVDDNDVNCLMLHPVGWPNHGPNVEMYLAEEAIGLVKSLGWQISRGPNWDTQEDDKSEEEEEDPVPAHLQ